MTEIGRQSVRKEGEIIPEQSTYSFADFLRKVVSAFARKGSKVECVQTANGFEFANRFSPSKREIKTLFEQNAPTIPIASILSPTLVGNSRPMCLRFWRFSL